MTMTGRTDECDEDILRQLYPVALKEYGKKRFWYGVLAGVVTMIVTGSISYWLGTQGIGFWRLFIWV